MAADMAAAQPVGPPAPLRTVPAQQRCGDQQPGPDGEIVVCGESPENSPYRVPRQFRNQPSHDDAEASWDTLTRDMEALERFGSQNVGPQGMSQHSRQVDCEWRAARQEAQGRRPDCGRRMQRDDPADWRRRGGR